MSTSFDEVDKVRVVLMKIVERVVRPVQCNIARKRKMRDEMLAHLSAIYDKELTRSGDPVVALEAAAKRFGNPKELTAELQATVPRIERWGAVYNSWFDWRPPETAERWMLRLGGQVTCVMLLTCGLAAAVAAREFGWSKNVLLVVRPIAAMALVMPISMATTGICYYRMRNSLVGVFGKRKSTSRALSWAAILAVATTAIGIGFLVMAYGGLPNPASDFWILAVFGLVWAGFTLLHARANGPQEIRDTHWALLDLDDKLLAA